MISVINVQDVIFYENYMHKWNKINAQLLTYIIWCPFQAVTFWKISNKSIERYIYIVNTRSPIWTDLINNSSPLVVETFDIRWFCVYLPMYNHFLWHEMFLTYHYDDVIMTMLASQITSLPVVCSIVYSDVNQRKHQSSASLAFVREIHRGPVNFPHKWPVTRKMFPFDDVIMIDSVVQDCSNSSGLAMELLESFTKPSIYMHTNATTWCAESYMHNYNVPAFFSSICCATLLTKDHIWPRILTVQWSFLCWVWYRVHITWRGWQTIIKQVTNNKENEPKGRSPKAKGLHW